MSGFATRYVDLLHLVYIVLIWSLMVVCLPLG